MTYTMSRAYTHETVLVPLQPFTCHPLLWALGALCGLSRAEISRRTGVGRMAIARYASGHVMSDRDRNSMLDLLKVAVEEIHQASDAHRKRAGGTEQEEAYKSLRVAVYETIRRLQAEHSVSERRAPVVGALLLKAVRDGMLERTVYANFHEYTPHKLRKLARRLGIRRVRRVSDGAIIWRPPTYRIDSTPSVGLRTKRMKQLWTVVDIIMLRTEYGDDGYAWTPVKTIEQQVLAKGFSRVLLYKCARDVRVLRKTEGFGAQKTTYWSRPPLPSRRESNAQA